ncbi:MAG TPA: hypothetical protein VJ400_06625 [Thermoplasmata archaeon]|nr:hypothetical protein [Thermoplasmata archaeon]
MDRSTLVRRTFHLASPVWLVWYWMPPDAWIGVRKELVLLFFLCGALLIEAGRLITGRQFLGLRGYESGRLSAYAWGSLGLAVGLLFFPGEIVIVTFWGMAWIDPLCAHMRKKRGDPWVPFVAYVALAAFLSLLVVPTALYSTSPWSPEVIAVFAPLAAIVALAAERPNLKHVDDDFLMHVLPMVVLAVLSMALGVDGR